MIGLAHLEAAAVEEVLAAHPKAKALHVLLVHILLGFRGKNGLMNPSRKTLARYCRVSVKTAARALADLKAWDVIDWKSGGLDRSNNKISNVYRCGEELEHRLFEARKALSLTERPKTAPLVGQSYVPRDSEVGEAEPLVGHSYVPLSIVSHK